MSPAAAAAAAEELHQAVQDALDLLQEATPTNNDATHTTLPLSSSSSLSSSSLSTNHPHHDETDANVVHPTTRHRTLQQEVTPPPTRGHRQEAIQEHEHDDDGTRRRRPADGRVNSISGERYELRRLARRLDRAITSLSEQEDDTTIIDHPHDGSSGGGAFMLSEQMIRDLFTVITTLSGLFETPSSNHNHNKDNSAYNKDDQHYGGGRAGPQQFVALYHNAVQTACQLLLEQMQMTKNDSILHPYYCDSPNDNDNDNDPHDHPAVAVVDDLLDRVVSLCLQTNHFSFVPPPHDHQHSNIHHHRSRGSSNHNNYYNDSNDDDENSGWILLGPAIFLLNKLLTQQQEHDDSILLPNLGVVENIKLLQLLWTKSLQDLSVPWKSQLLLLDDHPPPQHHPGDEDPETTHHAVGAMQEAKVQVRVLAGFLLRQLSLSISQSLTTTDHHQLPRRQTVPTIRSMNTFETWATQFVAQQDPQHEDAMLTKIDVEDFTDLASEIVVELMEYALDALDGVSASIRSLVTTKHPTRSASMSSSSSSSEFHEDDSPLSILDAGDSVMEDVGSMLCEAIRHTLYAVTMVELLQGVSGIQIISCPSKTIRLLYSSFSTFVASTCHEAMEHVSLTHSQGQRTTATTVTMNQFQNTRNAADDLLLRLSRLVLLHHDDYHHVTTTNPYAIQSEDEPTHHATSIAIMRALNSHGITDRNDSTFFLVNGSNSDEAHYSQVNNPTKRHSHEEGRTLSILKRARIHVLQAAATSSLILPGGFASLGQDKHCNDQDTEFPPGYERLEQVAFLTQSLIPPQIVASTTKDDTTISCEPSRSSNVLDPWHALLSRKIGSEIDALLNDTNHDDGSTRAILSEYAKMVQPCFDTMSTSQNQ